LLHSRFRLTVTAVKSVTRLPVRFIFSFGGLIHRARRNRLFDKTFQTSAVESKLLCKSRHM